MKYKNIILLMFSLPVFTLKAQSLDTLKIDISKTIEIALENNINLKKVKINTAILEAQIKGAKSTAMPQINGSAGFTDNFSLPTQILPGAVLGQSGDVPVQFGVRYQVSAGVEASQMIFNMAYFKNLKKLDAARATNDLQTLASVEELIYNVIQVYIQSRIANEQKEILNSNLNKINQLIQIAEAQFENGIIKKLDVNQLKVNKTNIHTEITNLNINEEQLLLAIKYYLDIDLNTPLVLTETLDNETTFQFTEELLLEENINYKLLEKQKEIAIKENQVINAGYYPSLNAFAQYNYTGQNNEFNFQEDTYSGFASGLWGLNLSVPIFDGLQKVRSLQENKLKIQQIELDQENFISSTEMEFRNAKTKIILNKEQVETQNENMELANEVYSITKLSYQEGIAPLTELLDTETSLKQAQTNFLTALLNLKLAELDYVKASGQLAQIIQNN